MMYAALSLTALAIYVQQFIMIIALYYLFHEEYLVSMIRIMLNNLGNDNEMDKWRKGEACEEKDKKVRWLEDGRKWTERLPAKT